MALGEHRSDRDGQSASEQERNPSHGDRRSQDRPITQPSARQDHQRQYKEWTRGKQGLSNAGRRKLEGDLLQPDAEIGTE